MAEAKFACGDFSQPVLQNVNKAQLKIRHVYINLKNIFLPNFLWNLDTKQQQNYTACTRLGLEIRNFTLKFHNLYVAANQETKKQAFFPLLFFPKGPVRTTWPA